MAGLPGIGDSGGEEEEEKTDSGRVSHQEAGLGERLHLWVALRNYLKNTNVNGAFRLYYYRAEEIESLDENTLFEVSPNPPHGSDYSEEDLKRFNTEPLLFISDWFGEVRGLGRPAVFEFQLYAKLHELAEEPPFSVEESGSEVQAELGRLLPELEQLIAAGERGDEIIAAVFGFEWGVE